LSNAVKDWLLRGAIDHPAMKDWAYEHEAERNLLAMLVPDPDAADCS
jgi:hypothetical protein